MENYGRRLSLARGKTTLLAACIAGGALSAAAAASGPSSPGKPQQISVYSASTAETFVDNNDDEARGAVNNPFGTHDKAAASKEQGDGPFPGDQAVFTFQLYANAKLDTALGSAVYTCQYYFDKYAFCDASFRLKDGTLIAAGTLNFNGQTFALAVTGGYGRYAGAEGDLEASPSGKHAQRLVFRLGPP